VIGGVGAGNILFPFQAGDVGHPGYWFLYERGVRRVIKRLLRPDSIFLDIGAHRGWHSSYALGLVGQKGYVVACEPHPAHAESLRRLASLNTSARFQVHEVAVSNEIGRSMLLISEEEGWHTLWPEFNDYCCNVPRKPLPVKTSTLDEIVSQHGELELQKGPRRAVIKIDAEGSELPILRGATETLQLPSVRALIVECTGGSGPFRQRALRCTQILVDAGYQLMVILNRRLRQFHEEDLASQVNLLATKPS
jgi:FkbM family methyltransferase